MDRYLRNITIDGFGIEGQEKLSKARVLVIGAGGLGSPVLLYLAAAGVGTLGIVDYDNVDETNLQRQIIHSETEIGLSKTESACKSVRALNHSVQTIVHNERLTAENAVRIIREYDFVVDCCDNYATKFLINDVCVAEGKPYSHGAISAMRGEAMTCIPGSADYRRVFSDPPQEDNTGDSSQTGVLGSVAGVIGSIQATEVIKYLTGTGDLLTNRILIFDGRVMTFHILKV